MTVNKTRSCCALTSHFALTAWTSIRTLWLFSTRHLYYYTPVAGYRCGCAAAHSGREHTHPANRSLLFCHTLPWCGAERAPMLGLLMGVVEPHSCPADGYCVSNGEVGCCVLVSEVCKMQQWFLYIWLQYHIAFKNEKDAVNIQPIWQSYYLSAKKCKNSAMGKVLLPLNTGWTSFMNGPHPWRRNVYYTQMWVHRHFSLWSNESPHNIKKVSLGDKNMAKDIMIFLLVIFVGLSL